MTQQDSAPGRPIDDGLERRKRLAITFTANAAGNLILIADKFFVLPMMLWAWNKDVVGIWFVVRSVPAFLSVGEMGFASVTANSMTFAVAKQDYELASLLYWSTLRLLNWISIAGLALTVAALSLAPIAEWLGCNHPGFATATFFSALYTVSIFQTQALYAAFRSIEMQAEATTAIQTIRVAELVAAIVALSFGGQLAALAATYAAVRLAGIVLMRLWLRKRIHWLHVDRRASWSSVRELVRPSFAMAGITFAQSIQLQGYTLILSAFTTPATVASYNAMRILARLTLQVGQTVSRTSWPEVTSLLAQNRRLEAYKLQRRGVFMTAGLTSLAALGLFLFGPWVFTVWTLRELEFIPSAFVMLTLSACLISITLACAVLQMAQSAHESISVLWCATIGVTLIVAVVLTPFIGEIGLTAIFLICDLVILTFVVLNGRAMLVEESIK